MKRMRDPRELTPRTCQHCGKPLMWYQECFCSDACNEKAMLEVFQSEYKLSFTGLYGAFMHLKRNNFFIEWGKLMRELGNKFDRKRMLMERVAKEAYTPSPRGASIASQGSVAGSQGR